MTILSEEAVRDAVGELDGWEVAGKEITTALDFADFRAAVAFVVRIAFEAEAANHHPDLDIRYNQVRVALSTHSEGGVTSNDVDLAQAIDALRR
ncbi:MAG: 4a-hydroxytetrahydrobiopterin dehydratase [Actinomycetota bacterium]|nr:4a-hydroxytetrahydrobiopterin dehydratase [Actinomycetota bacterium]